MGFFDKLIDKLDGDNPAKPVDPSHQGGYQQQAPPPQGQYQQPHQQQQYAQPPQQQQGYQQNYGYGDNHPAAPYGLPQGQAYGQGGYDQSQGQQYGQNTGYGHAAGYGQQPHGQQGGVDPALEQQIRSTTATTLSSRFTTQLHTAESSLHNVPPYDLHQKLALETEVKILKAVVGLCAGFGAVSDGSTGLVGGMRGMSMEHGGVAMTQGHPTDPYASHGQSTSTADKAKDDKKKLMLAAAGAGAVGLGAGMLLADDDSDKGQQQQYSQQQQQQQYDSDHEREREHESGSGSESSSDGGDYGGDDE